MLSDEKTNAYCFHLILYFSSDVISTIIKISIEKKI